MDGELVEIGDRRRRWRGNELTCRAGGAAHEHPLHLEEFAEEGGKASEESNVRLAGWLAESTETLFVDRSIQPPIRLVT